MERAHKQQMRAYRERLEEAHQQEIEELERVQATVVEELERAQATEPGPGAYETEILRTGGRSALSAYDTGEMMPSAAFASDAIRDLPWPSNSAAGGGSKASS